MEPRPQKPRPQNPPAGIQQHGAQPTPQVGPDPGQQTATTLQQPGYDPAAFVAPPRMEYDYSPLDLQPPGQRRKRQIIAGIIGALVVVAIGALLVAGWMALREDDTDPSDPQENNRVAELNATATTPPEQTEAQASTPGSNTTAATKVPAQPTPAPTSGVVAYDSTSIRAVLPVVESMPGAFTEAGDTPQAFADVVEALGADPNVEAKLTDLGWQASMSRNYNSAAPETTGSTQVSVSVHAFKDEASAQAALPLYADILAGFGWTPIEGPTYGGGSRSFTFSDTNLGEDSVTIYVVKDQLLYRVRVTGPAGFDSMPNAVYVVEQILAS